MFPNKLLGQNFIRCPWVTSTMIKVAELKDSDVVLEVGAGTGILTKELAKKAKKVIAVEKDKNLIVQYLRPLEKRFKNIEIIEGDFLKNFSKISTTYNLQATTYKLISSIPYYLTSRLIRVLLEQEPKPQAIVLTIQKEVAERICAKHPKMNLLAISVQVFGKPEIIKKVPASCFWPKPKVDSAIIKIGDISNDFFTKNGISSESFFKIVKKAFTHKRKILTNTIEAEPLYYRGSASIVKQKEMVKEVLKMVTASEKSRPEELSIEQWTSLVKNFGKIVDNL